MGDRDFEGPRGAELSNADRREAVAEEFERWRELVEPQLKRESFVTAWAKVAWLSEARTHKMGRDLAKLQYRIGRQRKANREALVEFLAREEELKRQIEALRKSEEVSRGKE